MYRITKVLNHNTVLGVSMEDNREYMLMGKGIGFKKKISERLEVGPEVRIYSLNTASRQGNARQLVRSIAPEFLEIADEILDYAEKSLGNLDRNVILPMAGHIEYAVKRVRDLEEIRNPLTEDIRALFYSEYKVAGLAKKILMERMGLSISEDEIGYIALHIHSALEEEDVSQSMQMAWAVRECVSFVEEESCHKIDVTSLSYNRLMNHVRYMVARIVRKEHIPVDMNEYMSEKYPEAFEMACRICRHIASTLKYAIDDVEIGYLAMHIERVIKEEQKG